MKSKYVSVRLDEETLASIDVKAKKLKTTRSQLIRNYINQLIGFQETSLLEHIINKLIEKRVAVDTIQQMRLILGDIID